MQFELTNFLILHLHPFADLIIRKGADTPLSDPLFAGFHRSANALKIRRSMAQQLWLFYGDHYEAPFNFPKYMYQKPIKGPHLHLVKRYEEIQFFRPYFFISSSNISIPFSLFHNKNNIK